MPAVQASPLSLSHPSSHVESTPSVEAFGSQEPIKQMIDLCFEFPLNPSEFQPPEEVQSEEYQNESRFRKE